MQGWEAYDLHGAGDELHGDNDKCFVFCEVWDERDRKRMYSALRYANGSGPPCDNILAAMADHPNFEQNR